MSARRPRRHVAVEAAPHLSAQVEFLSGPWPSLVVDGDGSSMQLDVPASLTAAQARQVVGQLAAAVDEWADAVDAEAVRQRRRRLVSLVGGGRG